MAKAEYIIQDDVTKSKYTFRLNNGKLTLEPVDASDTDASISVSANWPSVHGLQDGQPMNADTFNKPVTELAERTNYLYDKLRVFNRNDPLSTLLITDAYLDQDAYPQVGDVVYFDTTKQVFSKAVANVDVFDAFTLAASSLAVGILIRREGPKGTIVISGKLDMTLAGLSIDSMLEPDEKFRPGPYYLSSTTPGRITANPNGPRVLIGQFSGGDFAIIGIHPRSLGEAHVHRSYLLTGLPAGEQKLSEDGPEGIHSYVGYSPNYFAANEPSDTDVFPRLVFTGNWLSNSTNVVYTFVLEKYDGGVPERITDLHLRWERGDGASGGRIAVSAFDRPYEVENGFFVSLQSGGNVDGKVFSVENSDDDTTRTWSLTFPDAGKGWRSLTAAELERFESTHQGYKKPKFIYNIGFDRAMQAYYPPVPAKSASITMNGVELASDRLGGDYVFAIENDSIYWFDDSWDHVPWPTRYVSREHAVESWETKRLVLHFIRTASTETGPVTSLRGAPGSGVRVLACGSGDEYDVGDLMIDIDPIGDVVDSDVQGFNVVKEGGGGVFKTGPVVEKIVAGSGITISKLGKAPLGQGTVVISASNSGIRGEFEEVALQNAKQDLVGMFPYIRLLGWTSGGSNVPSAFVMKFHVPYDNADNLYAVHLLMSVFGTESYTAGSTRYAGIQLNYNILPDLNPTDDATDASANIKDDLIAPDASRLIGVPIVSEVLGTVTSYTAFDPILLRTTGEDIKDVTGKVSSALGNALPYSAECKKYMADHSVDVVGVRPGYTVAVRISRSDLPDTITGAEYTSPLGFMNMRWILERVK